MEVRLHDVEVRAHDVEVRFHDVEAHVAAVKVLADEVICLASNRCKRFPYIFGHAHVVGDR